MIEFDVETTGLQWWHHELFLVQFHCDGETKVLRHPQDRDYIQRWLEAGGEVGYRAWNSKFDLHFLEAAGYTLPPQSQWHDGLVLAHILDDRRAQRGGYGLQTIGDSLFGDDAGKDTELAVKEWLKQETSDRRKTSKATGTQFVRPNYSDVPDEIMFPYAAHDVELQRRICDVLEPKLIEATKMQKDGATLQDVYDLEQKVLGALYDVEKLGLGIDEKGAKAFEREAEDELTLLRDQAIKLSGDAEFNPASGAQLAAAFEARGVDLSHVRKTATGKRSVDAAALAGIDDPLATTMENLRGVEKLYSTYIWPLLHDEPDTTYGFRAATLASDGRLHSDLRQMGARTGRMSSSPNVQNWPRDDLRMRHLVCADEGKKLVAVDLDQIELRIFAAFVGEGALLEMMLDENADIHEYTAKMIGLGPRDRGNGIVESPRQRGKKFNYERIYGGGVRAIRQWHGVDGPTAKRYLLAYQDAYPEVVDLQNAIEIKLEARGHIRTPWGRRHRADNPRFADREAYKFVNFLVQGTAADLFKASVVRVHELGIPMIALTHDEILAEVDAGDADEAAGQITHALIDHPQITKLIALDAEAKIVDRWSQAKTPDFDPGW